MEGTKSEGCPNIFFLLAIVSSAKLQQSALYFLWPLFVMLGELGCLERKCLSRLAVKRRSVLYNSFYSWLPAAEGFAGIGEGS